MTDSSPPRAVQQGRKKVRSGQYDSDDGLELDEGVTVHELANSLMTQDHDDGLPSTARSKLIASDSERAETEKDNKAKQRKDNSIARWRVELIAATIAVVGIITLVAVLAKFDKQPQQEYHFIRNQTYTLNAIVALIATVTRVAMGVTLGSALSQCMWNWFVDKSRDGTALNNLTLFDQASRGAWGSIKLLCLLPRASVLQQLSLCMHV